MTRQLQRKKTHQRETLKFTPPPPSKPTVLIRAAEVLSEWFLFYKTTFIENVRKITIEY